jgi:CheY-like chemotaxis protein
VPDPKGKDVARVLLVDPDRGIRAAAESALTIRGFQVDAYPDPLRALEALRQQNYDAALVDARMPRMDGLELAMQIRDLPGLARLPVLIFDERPSPQSREAAQSLGAVGYVAKPSRWTELAEGLLDLLDGWSQRRYERYAARLRVQLADHPRAAPDLTYQVGRGGMGIQTRRDVIPGARERYRITMPGTFGSVNVEGTVVHRLAEQGHVSLRLGVRFLRFPDRDEARWIRLIDTLALRAMREGSGPEGG